MEPEGVGITVSKAKEPMAFEAEKTMFEVYRESTYSGLYRVVYFTDLQDHDKDVAINRALAGEHYFDGFLKNYGKEEAKLIVEGLLNRMNQGEAISPDDFVRELGPHYLPV